MVSKLKNSKSKIFALVLIGIISIKICNNILYQHIHILADGTIVSHSHPYKKNKNSGTKSNHYHTDAQLALIDSALLLFQEKDSIVVIIAPLNSALKYCFLGDFDNINYFSSKQQRAPPII